MYILGIDTSTKIGSVAIFDSEKGILASLIINVKLNHSDTVMNAVESVVKFSGIAKEEIQAVAVGIGPGSFTGIRVGLGSAKGIAFSLNIPIVGVNTLDALAKGVIDTGCVTIPMIDARKERVYYSVYKFQNGIQEKIAEYADDTIENIMIKYENEKVVFTGDGSIEYKNTLIKNENAILQNRSQAYISAAIIAEIGYNRIESKLEDNIYELEPFYISKSQAERLRDMN